MKVQPPDENTGVTGVSPKPLPVKGAFDASAQAKFSPGLREVLNKIGDRYVKNFWDTRQLLRGFEDLEQLHPTTWQIESLERIIKLFEEFGGKIDPILPDYTRLVRAGATPMQLGLVERGISKSSIGIYEVISCFANAIEGNVEGD